MRNASISKISAKNSGDIIDHKDLTYTGVVEEGKFSTVLVMRSCHSEGVSAYELVMVDKVDDIDKHKKHLKKFLLEHLEL